MRAETQSHVALVGQPNCGKSTVFNALTGARQQVANWPGVTVDKVSGWFTAGGRRLELVDLPGAYSLTSFSPEERVTRDFLLHNRDTRVVNVVAASSLRQGLTLTLQLLEMGLSLMVDLNMVDVAEKRGLPVDIAALESHLQVPVVATSMKRGQDRRALRGAIGGQLGARRARTALRIDYGALEPWLRELEERLRRTATGSESYPWRWAAVKLMEGDAQIEQLLGATRRDAGELLTLARRSRQTFAAQFGEPAELHIGLARNARAAAIADACIRPAAPARRPFSDRIDGLVCHRVAGPLILVTVMYLLYYFSIVKGYELTGYTWPLLARMRALIESLLPAPGFIDIPLARSFVLWFTDSINALLNYVPIFFILFTLIAVLEDSGYMPRMAFIMDRLLNRFGLHGQSILPMVLGGVYVGGCAVPAVMSSKGIPDERSRLATILTIPLLNCQAKVPLYILLVNAYYTGHKGFAMFFISTVSLLLVLPVAKLLTLTVLKGKETAPFVMEMPAYHMPTFRNVFGKSLERTWLFLRKIATVVAAVATVIFGLLQFPGLSAERVAHYEAEKEQLVARFRVAAEAGDRPELAADGHIMPLVQYWEDYRKARLAGGDEAAVAEINRRFRERNPDYFPLVQPDGQPQALALNRALRNLARGRDGLLLDMRGERLQSSLFGSLGRWLEPFTAPAGFDWRINVALLSSLAAKENSVATLGALFDQEGGEGALEERLAGSETGLTPLHALALMVFMVLYPPCVATAMAVKVQTGSLKWMLFSMAYPMVLGLMSAMLIFTGGRLLGVSGVQAMALFYGLALTVTVATGLLRPAAGVAARAAGCADQREAVAGAEP